MNHTVASHAPIDLNHLSALRPRMRPRQLCPCCGGLGVAPLIREPNHRGPGRPPGRTAVQPHHATRSSNDGWRRPVCQNRTPARLPCARPSGPCPRLTRGRPVSCASPPPTTLARCCYPPSLAGFSKRYPAVEVDVRLTTRQVDLVAEGLRCRLARLFGPARRLIAHLKTAYGTWRCRCLPPPPICPTHRTADGMPADLLRHRVIMLYGMKLPSAFELPNGTPKMLSDDVLFVHGAVKASLGIGILADVFDPTGRGHGAAGASAPEDVNRLGHLALSSTRRPNTCHARSRHFASIWSTYLKGRPMGHMAHAEA